MDQHARFVARFILMPVFAAWAAMADAEPATVRAEAKEREEIENQSAQVVTRISNRPWHPVFNCMGPRGSLHGMIAR